MMGLYEQIVRVFRDFSMDYLVCKARKGQIKKISTLYILVLILYN